MDTTLRSYLRLAAPNMPPEVAWPVVDECKNYESLEQVPPAMRRLINQYLPEDLQMSAQEPI